MSRFEKSERLHSKKAINKIVEKANCINGRVFRLLWNITQDNVSYPARIAISVPKRNFKNAVSRNLLKRRIKECYRNNKQQFYSQLNNSGIQVNILLIYTKKIIIKSSEIEPEIILTLQSLINEIEGKKKENENSKKRN
ncbi:ribonuclease P protein component [Bacteroidota bacterium]